jgi:hypothetical protein
MTSADKLGSVKVNLGTAVEIIQRAQGGSRALISLQQHFCELNCRKCLYTSIIHIKDF